MENDNQILITPEAKESLTVAAKWAKFLAIMGFIGIGFMVMFAFSSLVLGKILLSRMIPNGGLVSTIYFVIFLVMAVVMFPVPLFLYRFAVHTQLAVVADDSIIMAESLGWMKKYFRYYGILTIVLICFYALALVTVFIGLVMKAF